MRSRRRDLRRALPFLVWCGVLIVVVGLYIRRTGGIAVTGFSEEIRYDIAPETTGRLKRLAVRLNQEVTTGQIVASLEDDDLLLELQEARTELHRLRFELDREKALYDFSAAGQQVDQQTDMRRFARDVENAHVDYLDALSTLAESRIELQALELTLERSRRLEEKGLTPIATLDTDRLAYQALKERVAVEESRVETLLAAYKETDARYARFLKEYMTETPDADLILKPLENAIRVQEIRVEQVNMSIGDRVLRSPVDGLVAGILRRPGEIVTTGQPVLSILEPVSGRVVAFIPEHRILDVEEGHPVRLSRVAETGSVMYSSISHLGASLEQLPPRYAPGSAMPAWGLAVYIPLPDSLRVRPGEAFHIYF